MNPITQNTNTSKLVSMDIPVRPPGTLPGEGPVNIDAVMRDIEKKTEEKLQTILAPVATARTGQKIEFIASQDHDLGDTLIRIMSAGAEEFTAKTGRNMTYSEMRSMYG